MNRAELEYSARVRAIQEHSEYILGVLHSADSTRIQRLLEEERDAYQSLMERLSDQMRNGKSPALRSLASNLYQYFQSMQRLAGEELVNDMQGEGTDVKEAEEEAAGLLEEYTLDSIEQSLRSMLLLSYHEELSTIEQ